MIRSEGGPLSFLVDEIRDVLDVPTEAALPLPANMPAEQRELLQSVHQLDGGLLLILDRARVLERAAR